MLNINYAKLIDGYPAYAPNPIVLTEPIEIDSIIHPAGATLSLSGAAESHYAQLGYKPVTRTTMPTRDGYYYTETWTETEMEIVREWEEHEQPEDELTDAVTALETLGYTEDSNG